MQNVVLKFRGTTRLDAAIYIALQIMLVWVVLSLQTVEADGPAGTIALVGKILSIVATLVLTAVVLRFLTGRLIITDDFIEEKSFPGILNRRIALSSLDAFRTSPFPGDRSIVITDRIWFRSKEGKWIDFLVPDKKVFEGLIEMAKARGLAINQ